MCKCLKPQKFNQRNNMQMATTIVLDGFSIVLLVFSAALLAFYVAIALYVTEVIPNRSTRRIWASLLKLERNPATRTAMTVFYLLAPGSMFWFTQIYTTGVPVLAPIVLSVVASILTWLLILLPASVFCSSFVIECAKAILADIEEHR